MTFLARLFCASLVAAVLLKTIPVAATAEFAAPFVPTATSVVNRMLEVARVGPDDYIIDLGSGDGRIVITAARKYGAQGFGVDIDPKLVARANANARAAGVGDRARFYEADLFTTDLSKATVVTIYLLTRSVVKLQSRLFDLKPGTRIVSHAGSMGEWRSDRFEMLDVTDRVRSDAPKKTYIYLWIVPARVAGNWRWSMPVGSRTQDYELALVQDFQNFSGTVRVAGTESTIQPGKMDGARINLEFEAEVDGIRRKHRLSGRIDGQSIVGTAMLDAGGARSEAAWKASRLSVATPVSKPERNTVK